MDDPKNSSSSNESQENEDSDNSQNNAWDISPKEEKNYWEKELFNKYFYNPMLCPKCKKPTFKINEKKKDDIINPYYLSCSKKNCKYRKNMRYYSFFKIHRNLPCSVIHFIIIQFIDIKNNATQIKKQCQLKFNKSPSIITINNILSNLRKVIADHMKYKYRKFQIGGSPEKNITVALDEHMWTHLNQEQIWVVGAIETKSRKMRFDFMKERNSDNLKIFVQNHIEPGTHITHDGWAGYNFLEDPDESVWTHEIHIHGGGDFGYGDASTSHIEHTWAHLQEITRSMYGNTKSNNWLYFFREAEFRLNISKRSSKEKMNIFEGILREVYELNDFDFFELDELLSFDNYDY